MEAPWLLPNGGLEQGGEAGSHAKEPGFVLREVEPSEPFCDHDLTYTRGGHGMRPGQGEKRGRPPGGSGDRPG